jgi:hypothetical protein
MHDNIKTEEIYSFDNLENTWEIDKAERSGSDKLTAQFHSSVTVLKYLVWGEPIPNEDIGKLFYP